MVFNSNLKEALNTSYNSTNVPKHLKHRVLAKATSEKRKPKMAFPKKAILVCIVLLLLTPTLAFGYSFLANQIYGSAEMAKNYGVTQEEYLAFDNKLIEASKILTIKEFGEFIILAKDLVFFMIDNGDMSTTDRATMGQVDITTLSPEKQAEYLELITKIQPYFDKLNNN